MKPGRAAALLPRSAKGAHSRSHGVLELTRQRGYTVRQLYDYSAGARALGLARPQNRHAVKVGKAA